MRDSYIYVKTGKNSFWRYLLSLVFIGFVSVVMTLVSYVGYSAFMNIDFNLVDSDSSLKQIPVIHENILFNLSTFITFLSIWFSVVFILKRPLKSLITYKERVNFKRILWSFMVFSIIFLIGVFLVYLTNPSNYVFFPFKMKDYAIVFFTTLLLTPFQTASEELIFRGILLQFLGKKIRNSIILALLIGLIFGSLHFSNPEMTRSFLLVGTEFIFAGFMLTYIALRTGTLEISLGAHAANNMLIFWLFTMDDTVGADLPAIFFVKDMSALASLLSTVFTFTLFYFFTYRKYIRD